MKRFAVLCIIFLISIIGSAADKKAFTIEDLYSLKRASGISISKDGQFATFSLSSSDLFKGKSYSDIWILNIKTGNTRQLTHHKASDYAPFFSEDGKKIYFISTRINHTPQLFELNMQGGDPVQLTSFYAGVSSPEFINDHTVLFSSYVFPECGADSECQKKYSKKLNDGPTQGHYGKDLLFRHWDHYRDWQYSHLFKTDTDTGEVISITEGKQDYPTYNGMFTISPDKDEICVTVNFDKDAARSTNSDLLLININTGEQKNITDSNQAFDGDPTYSPDGNYIAYRKQNIPSYESDRFILMMYNRKTDTSQVMSDAIDNWVESPKWSPDSRFIYFVAHEKGTFPLYRVNVENGMIEKVLQTSQVSEYEILPDNTTVLFSRSSIGEPYELYSYSIGAESPERLTTFNKHVVDNVDIRPGESMFVKGADGKDIHVYLVKPHNFDPAKKYPLILNVHGGPQYQWADTFRGDWQVYPGAGYIVAFPNPHGSSGYGQKFTEAISGDYDGKVMEDIDKVTEALAELPYVDKNRMGAMGWSWGGYAMMWLEGNSNKYKALVAMMGIFDLRSMHNATEELWFVEWDNKGTPWDNYDYYERATPSNYVKNFKTPCLIITGEKDYRVPYTQSLQFFTSLKRRGVDSEIIVFTNDGHWPNAVKSMPVYYNAHLEWFHKYLGGDKAPYDSEKMLRNLQFKACD